MKNKVLILTAFILSASAAMTACGDESSDSVISVPDRAPVTEQQATAPPHEVGYDGMEAMYGSSLNDGEYKINVDSSSSMFNITDCTLTVSGGKMTAAMTMGGTGYLYVFMGTSSDAVAASGNGNISHTENDNGEHVFVVPVEALDMEIDCAAFSERKEEWYDRKLVFRADSLPLEAFTDDSVNTVTDLDLEDGSYTCEVTLEGGSGKASVESPSNLIVKNGEVIADIIFSSPNYDYVIVDGEKYLPINTDGNSEFEIPVSVFDRKFAISADTTAMSAPHEIEYTLYFDSSSLEKAE